MNWSSLTPVTLWQSVFGTGSIGVLADAMLLFLIALLLLTYLGAGLSAITLPKSLRPVGWIVAPYLGYSTLVAVTAFMVAFGGNVTTSLVTSLALATAANLWWLQKGTVHLELGSLRGWLLLFGLALPSYAITAVSMAHNGSLAYVGPNGDIYLLVPLAEWLKTHSSPLFSLNSTSLLSPYWNATVPPIGNWSEDGAHLGYGNYGFIDTNPLFQQGPRYLQSALGLLLGWDSFLVFRPTQALMLSLALPATYLFCKQLVRAGTAASLTAAALVGLNGTLFFWILLGHPGQASATFLVPIVALTTLAAIDSHERMPTIAAALMISALLASYYHGAPILAFLLAPGLTYVAIKTGRWREVIVRGALISGGIVVLALPEHVKLVLVWATNTLLSPVGWGNPGFAALGDALGTTLDSRAFDLVAGKGQIGEGIMTFLSQLSAIATAVALPLGLIGVVRSKVPGIDLYRVILVGAVVMLAALRIDGYPYGYSKAQSIITFLFATAVAMGAEGLWHRLGRRAAGQRRSAGTGVLVALFAAAFSLFFGAVAANLLLGSYVSWKPVGNMWSPKSWEASALGMALAAGITEELSSAALVDPETTYMTLYFLRNQRLQGPIALEGALGWKVALSLNSRRGDTEEPDIDILGTSEVASARGLAVPDRIWAGSLLAAYRRPTSSANVAVRVQTPVGSGARLPASLPTAAEILSRDRVPSNWQEPTASGFLFMTLAAESPASVDVTSKRQHYSFQVGKGVSVRSVPIDIPDQVTLLSTEGSQPWLLSAVVRTGIGDPQLQEDYPKALAAVGDSSLKGNVISTRFTYLDVQVPLSHSLDLYDSTGNFHPGWFELPTNPDERLKDVQFDLNGVTLEHHTTVNGVQEQRPFSTRLLSDGEYVAYFSTWSGSTVAKRIPLYRYRLDAGQIADFEAFPLRAVWNGGG